MRHSPLLRRLVGYGLCPVLGLAASAAVFTATGGIFDSTPTFVAWIVVGGGIAGTLAALLTAAGEDRRAGTAIRAFLATLALAVVTFVVLLVVFWLGCVVLPDEPCLN
jgi:phosphotransferase system  glucose/maltose/N-acetylglucosamine-specific IIC component